jgi:hypothetical protein
MVKHSKKAKLNIMHMTVNFLGFFFGLYGLGKVKLKIKWPGRLEKTQI